MKDMGIRFREIDNKRVEDTLFREGAKLDLTKINRRVNCTGRNARYITHGFSMELL